MPRAIRNPARNCFGQWYFQKSFVGYDADHRCTMAPVLQLPRNPPWLADFGEVVSVRGSSGVQWFLSYNFPEIRQPWRISGKLYLYEALPVYTCTYCAKEIVLWWPLLIIYKLFHGVRLFKFYEDGAVVRYPWLFFLMACCHMLHSKFIGSSNILSLR